MKKHSRRELPLTSKLLIGTAVSVSSIALVSLLFTLISSFTKDPTSLSGILSLVSLLVAGTVSGFTNAKATTGGGVVIAALSSLLSSVLMLAIGFIIAKGSLPLGIFLNYLAYIGISTSFAALATKLGDKNRRYR